MQLLEQEHLRIMYYTDKMKRILLLIPLLLVCLQVFSQSTDYGTKIRNNFYHVRGTDTTWFQLNDTALLYNSSKKMKFNDTLFIVSVEEGQRAVDSFVLVLDSDGRVGYLPIDSVGSTGGGGTGWDSIYVENVKWIKNLDTIPTNTLDQIGGVDLANATTPMDVIYTDSISSGTVTDSMSYIIEPPHLYQGFEDSAVTLAITQNVWTQITNATQDLYTVEDAEHMRGTLDTIYIQVDGDYKFVASFSFQGVNNETWKIQFFKNGSMIGRAANRSTGTNSTGNVLAYEDCVAGDKITLKILNLTDNDDAVAVSSAVYAERVHP